MNLMQRWLNFSLKTKAVIAWVVAWVVCSVGIIGIGGAVVFSGTSIAGGAFGAGWGVPVILGAVIIAALWASVGTFVGVVVALATSNFSKSSGKDIGFK